MSDSAPIRPSIVVGRDKSGLAGVSVADLGWRLATLTAMAVLAVALFDLLALWYPVRIGTLEWEFATVTTTADSLPLSTIALTMLAASAMHHQAAWAVRVVSAVFVVYAVVVGAMLLLHGLNIPIALQSGSQAAKPMIIKASVKSIANLLVYLTLYVLLAVTTFRSLKRANSMRTV